MECSWLRVGAAAAAAGRGPAAMDSCLAVWRGKGEWDGRQSEVEVGNTMTGVIEAE